MQWNTFKFIDEGEASTEGKVALQFHDLQNYFKKFTSMFTVLCCNRRHYCFSVQYALPFCSKACLTEECNTQWLEFFFTVLLHRGFITQLSRWFKDPCL